MEMVMELIAYIIIGELIVINGVATWYRYTDTINELKGDNNNG